MFDQYLIITAIKPMSVAPVNATSPSQLTKLHKVSVSVEATGVVRLGYSAGVSPASRGGVEATGAGGWCPRNVRVPSRFIFGRTFPQYVGRVELLLSCRATSREEWRTAALTGCRYPARQSRDSIDGDIDLRGFFGIDDGIRAGFNAVRVNVSLGGPESAGRYEELAATLYSTLAGW